MDLTLTLTEDDANAFMQLADAAVRAHGLQVVRQAVKIMDLLDAAAAASSEPTATTPDEDSSDA